MESKRKVAVVTGANAGVGFCIAKRLLMNKPNLQLCLACRSRTRANEAVARLSKLNPEQEIHVIDMDTSSMESVFKAAKELKEKYEHINYLYLNAGMMRVKGIDWSRLWNGLFSCSEMIHMFTTGAGILIHEDEQTSDGMQQIFQTNLFGHYVLAKELQDRFGYDSGHQEPSQIVWTSSSNALESNFDIDDIQHKKGKDPYSSSKYAMDIVSVGLNERLNKKNVYSHTVCPGLMATTMTNGILPAWCWTLIFPILFLIRIFIPTFTYNPSSGVEALVWLSEQEPASLDPYSKYQSLCNFMGRSYVKKEKLKISNSTAAQLLKQLDALHGEKCASASYKDLLRS